MLGFLAPESRDPPVTAMPYLLGNVHTTEENTMLKSVNLSRPNLKTPQEVRDFANAKSVMEQVTGIGERMVGEDNGPVDLDRTTDLVSVHEWWSSKDTQLTGTAEFSGDGSTISFSSVNVDVPQMYSGSVNYSLSTGGDEKVYSVTSNGTSRQVTHNIAMDTLTYESSV